MEGVRDVSEFRSDNTGISFCLCGCRVRRDGADQQQA